MQETLLRLEKCVPPPQRIPYLDHFVYRYVEKTLHQALIQKLARVVTGIQAATILLEYGFVQEQGVLQRTLDELREDIAFLAFSASDPGAAGLQKEYLDAFYQEDFEDPKDPTGTLNKRQMVSRHKIQGYLSRIEGAAIDPSTLVANAKAVSKTYSGFVHAASPHIMDMYGGEPPGFHLEGMLGTPVIEDYRQDLWNYYFRGITSFAMAAKVFGDADLYKKIRQYSDDFARESGMDQAVQRPTKS